MSVCVYTLFEMLKCWLFFSCALEVLIARIKGCGFDKLFVEKLFCLELVFVSLFRVSSSLNNMHVYINIGSGVDEMSRNKEVNSDLIQFNLMNIDYQSDPQIF